MKIFVTAKPNKKKRCVEKTDSTHYVVSVMEPAKQGMANLAIIDALSEFFQIPKSRIILTSGQITKYKAFEVPNHLAQFEPIQTQIKLL